MNDNGQLDQKDDNTTPSGLPKLPLPYIGAAYKEDINSDMNVKVLIIISLAAGVMAIFTWCLLGLVSIITSTIALKKINKSRRKGIVKWLAIAGLGLGIINIAYYIIVTVYFIIVH